jgi:exo-beta-1,3-glucanase (GH17 family)
VLPVKLTAIVLIMLCCAASVKAGDLDLLLRQTRWVAYAPTSYNPDARPPAIPSDASVSADLQVLRRAGFDGLITYGSELPSIVYLAAQESFSAVLLGVWDPSSQSEIALAVVAARNPVVKGIIVGNEGLMFRRYGSETLRRAMEQVRRETGKPVSTTEVIETFYTNRDLVDWSDFITVNAHPYFHGHRDPVRAVDWTLGAWDRLTRQIPDKPIFFKEVGLPVAGAAENNGQNQSEFYFRLLTTTDVQFAFFEAFDQLYKSGPVEESWGIFRADRSPKPAAAVLLNRESCAGPLLRSWCGH